MLDPDRLLMTHFFQRIVDLLAGRTTNFNLARSCVAGAVVFQMAILVDYALSLDWFWFMMNLSIYTFTPLMAFFMLRTIARTERLASEGILFDPYGRENRRARCMWLALAVFFVLISILTRATVNMFSASIFLCFTSMAYFHDCIPAPPLRRNFIPDYFKKAFSAWHATPSSTSPTCSSVPGM